MKKLTDYMINAIQYGDETRSDEFKPPMGWFKTKRHQKMIIAKAALAMVNTPNGGNIFIGISQKQDRSGGVIFYRRGINNRQFCSFNNPDDMGRFLNPKSNLPIKFEIHGGEVPIEGMMKKFIVIRVYESRTYIPVCCTINYKPRTKRFKLCKNAIYIRSLSDPIESKIISSREEWEEMIRRLFTYKEKILHKDLIAACQKIRITEEIKPKRKKITQKAKKQYDKERKGKIVK